ncbi:MAG: DNA alkylation repair protein [Candidatus Lokiarchaeota archaeon]|nr:DNA alkylation repair protein [Candidatus Lokiarchaeota archaeon]
MTISQNITHDIQQILERTTPSLTKRQIERRDKILNSDNPKFIGYGHKISEIEKIVKQIYNKYKCSYEDALAIFKNLVSSNIHEEKFAGIFFLNHFKSNFNQATLDMFEDQFSKHCDTWAFCDSSCIRVIGPFLGKKNNQKLAKNTIEKWSNSENLWVRRASLVILLKIVMVKKEFNADYVFDFVEKMLKYPEDYIQKGIGWLLKTCSNYNPDSIFNYLIKNKMRLSRLILRFASEKLSKEKRVQILKK